MGVFDVFSKRKATQAGLIPGLQTEQLSDKFRVQMSHLLVASLGKWVVIPAYLARRPRVPANEAWQTIHEIIIREHGRVTLTNRNDNPLTDCLTFLMQAETDHALDLLEISLRYIDLVARRWTQDERLMAEVSQEAGESVAEFNVRCRENGVGYQYEKGRIIPAASPYVHDEVVRPALVLLQDEGFRGPQEEFLAAHAKLRQGDNKGAIVEACKAFESTMKTVCDRKRWAYDPSRATAKDLVRVLLDNGLVPPCLQAQFDGYRNLLESGVPTIRNKQGGHGQGPEPVEVPRELAEYALHLTAVNIVFLVKLFKAS